MGYSRISEIFHHSTLKIYNVQDFTRLKSQCSCKSSQHNVTYKEAGVITPPLYFSSSFTNTSESGTHNHSFLKRNPTMRDKSSKTRKRKSNSRNIRQSFRTNAKKYNDLEAHEYQTSQRPKIKGREVSFNGINNKFKKNDVNESPCEKGPCRKSHDASKFFHCICDRSINANCINVNDVNGEGKKSKRKKKNTCICYGTGDYKDVIIEDIDSEYPKKLRNKNKIDHICRNFDKNNKYLDICKEGLCTEAAKKKNILFSCKCNKIKAEIKPTECINSTCNITKNIKTTNVKLKNKVINPGNNYSQKFKEINYPGFDKGRLNQNTCVKGLCEDALLNQKQNFVCKCIKQAEINECTDDTCNIGKNKYSLKSKQSQTFRKESKNQKTGLIVQKKNRFICYCLALRAKLYKKNPKDKNVLKEQGNLKKILDSKQDQTGEPFFNIKVNSIDMRTLNPDEVRDKVMALGKLEKVKSCICPSHNIKTTNFLLKTACPAGVCKKSFKNKKTNFTCKCDDGKTKMCSDTTCEADAQMTHMYSWPTKQSNPIFEMKLDSHNMNVLNTNEIRNKMYDIEKSGKKELCPSGVCQEAVAHNARYICKCFHRRRQIETDECFDDTCRQTNLVQIENYPQSTITNHLKSKISCICSRILSKSDNLSKLKFNRIKRNQPSNMLKNPNCQSNFCKAHMKSEISNRKQGLKINFQNKKIENDYDNNCLHKTETSLNRIDKNIAGNTSLKNENFISKSLNEKGEFGITTDVNTQNKHCSCCICDAVKSDCKCMNTSRKIKCTEMLCRSCSNLFRSSCLRRPRHRRKRLLLSKNKEKTNIPSFKNQHAYTEICVCCFCGQKSQDCTCERSLRKSKCKYILCQSISRLLRRYHEVTYPEKCVQVKRIQTHKRKSVSLPIEKMFYGAKSHNTKYKNMNTNKNLKPISVSFDNTEQRNVNESRKYRQSIITQKDKGERTCSCSHICECELLNRKNRLKQGSFNKKQNKLSKRKKMKKKSRRQSQKQKKYRKSGLRKKKEWQTHEKNIQKEVARKEKVRSKKRLKQLKLEKKQLEAISKGREEVEETSCLADFFIGFFKLGLCIVKGFVRVLFKFITDPKGSIRYTKQRLRDPAGTYERIKSAFLEFWGIKKLQMQKSIAGSEKMAILSDTFQNSSLYQAFSYKGKTKKEKKLIEQNTKRRRKRILKMDREAMHGCRHMLLHTLRKTPCMWVYHVCPQFYPQCLSCLAFWHNFTDLLLFLLAFVVWTPCILCFEGVRALSCCLLCTG